MKTIVKSHLRKGKIVRQHLRKLKIPVYAKVAAKKGLELRETLPKSKQFGITQEEANKLGIDSGITRAKRIINNNYMPEWEVRKVSNFGKRFWNKTGERAEGAHLIWGGREFEKKAEAIVKRWNNEDNS